MSEIYGATVYVDPVPAPPPIDLTVVQRARVAALLEESVSEPTVFDQVIEYRSYIRMIALAVCILAFARVCWHIRYRYRCDNYPTAAPVPIDHASLAKKVH